MKTRFCFSQTILFLTALGFAAFAANGCGSSKFQSGSNKKVGTGEKETVVPATTQTPDPDNNYLKKQGDGLAKKQSGTDAKDDAQTQNQQTNGESGASPRPAAAANDTGNFSAETNRPSTTPVASPKPSDMPVVQATATPGAGQVNNPAATPAPTHSPALATPKPAEFKSDSGDGLSSDDKDSIAKCLAQWPNHPFVAGNTYSVRKISLAFSVGGITLGGDDSATPNPKLVLITQSINLGIFDDSAVYNFMNPNGYYCMKNQFNLIANVEINLHCRARLASSSKQFNVLSVANGAPSQNQINLLSNVFVRRVCN